MGLDYVTFSNFLEIEFFDEELEDNKKSIYVLHYPKDKKLVSYGLINDITEDKIINYNCNIEKGSSCNPILSLNNFKIIGLHYGHSNKKKFNYGIYIKHIIIEFYKKKYNNSGSSLWKNIGKAAAITGGVIAGAALLPVTLGFGTAGIVGGSIAAGIQATIGNVAAGSLFAISTSLGMTGVFASTSAVGTVLGAGGLTAYLKDSFNPEKDAELIYTTIEQNDKVDIIVGLLENRSPSEREKIREKYNKKYYIDNQGRHRDFDEDIKNFINDQNKKMHVDNLLKRTRDITAITESVKNLFCDNSFADYLEKKFVDSDSLFGSLFQRNEINSFSSKFITYPKNDKNIIETVKDSEDEPLIIIRLLEHRTEEQRKLIFNTPLKKEIIGSIRNYMPDYEKKYFDSLIVKTYIN